MTKYIFITGGVVSSLGKVIVSSSVASLLTLCKFVITYMEKLVKSHQVTIFFGGF